MKMENTKVVIMAGGIGSRFWPVSTKHKPKQFLDILGTGKTLLQETFERFAKVVGNNNVYIITNHAYKAIILNQLPQANDGQVLSEPFGKNTAACVAYAAHKFSEEGQDTTLIIAPSDHLVLNPSSFYECLDHAVQHAQSSESLVTLGIKPHRPDTGYGYIQYLRDDDHRVNKVKTFTEKPPLETAKQFLESGDFLWNSGMFIWNCSSILNSFNEFLPEMSLAFAEARGAYNTKIEFEEISRIYAQIQSISIDNAILEKADNVYVVPSEFGWSDLGTWKSVMESTEKNNGNYVINAKLHAIDSEDNLVYAPGNKLVVLQGLKNLFVVDTEKALLICQNDFEQDIKAVTTELKKKYNEEYT